MIDVQKTQADKPNCAKSVKKKDKTKKACHLRKGGAERKKSAKTVAAHAKNINCGN